MAAKTVKSEGRVIYMPKYAGSIPLSVITRAVDKVTGSVAGHSVDIVQKRNKRQQLHRGSKKKK